MTRRSSACGGKPLREGNRVVCTQNDRSHGCMNGDVDIFRVLIKDGLPQYGVQFPDGRFPVWPVSVMLSELDLAYAMTAHKAQGSAFDIVLFPVFSRMRMLLHRNLIYTVISRAREHLVLYGSREALDNAIETPPPPRKSMLITKTHAQQEALQQLI